MDDSFRYDSEGPFCHRLENLKAFHDAVWWQRDEAARVDNQARVVFTHCDLALQNILVRADGDGQLSIAAILDWEHAGWMPEYWEYCTAMSHWGRKGASVLLETPAEPAIRAYCAITYDRV
jgi:thiamine kinase-like enzyme